MVLEKRGYNGFGQLTSLYRDTLETCYTYQPDGFRQSKLYADGSSVSHIWDGVDVLAEFGNNGNVFARYLRGIGLVARDIGGQLEYYLYNGHSDVIERTSANGTTLKRYDYDAFGVEREPEVLDCNPYRYCGEYLDLSSGHYYLRNRCYNPSIGRFSQEDPIRSGLNWYTYADNNPVMFCDPLGLSSTRPGDIIADVSHILDRHYGNASSFESSGSSSTRPGTVVGCVRHILDRHYGNSSGSFGTQPGTVIAVMDSAGNWGAPNDWYAPPQTGGITIGLGLLLLGVLGLATLDAANHAGLNPPTMPSMPGMGQWNAFHPSQHMANWNTALTSDALSDIAGSHGLGQCVEAAKAMIRELRRRGHTPWVAEIQFSGIGRYNNVVSNSSPVFGPNTAISTNGYHAGVLFRETGLVYCNVHPQGLIPHVWLNDFEGLGMRDYHFGPTPRLAPRNFRGLF